MLRRSYWKRELTTARVLKPAYFTLVLRWCTWVLALLLTMSGVLLPENQARSPALLGLTGLWLLVQTIYLPVLRGNLPTALRRSGLVQEAILPAIDHGAIWSTVEVGLALLVIALTGGWGSPFYMFGLATVVTPALLFSYRAAFITGFVFAGLYALAVAANPVGFARAIAPGAVDRFIAYLFVPVPFALFAAYLGQTMHGFERERDRLRHALVEARVLQAVTAAGLRHVADPAHFVAATVTHVRRAAGLRGFVIVYQVPERDDETPVEPAAARVAVAGFGPLYEEVAAQSGEGAITGQDASRFVLPLAQGGRPLGTLVAEAREIGSRRAFLTALAGQVATALANANLTADAERLAVHAERARLAREIHDSIAQSVFMLTINLEACGDLVESDPARLRSRLKTLTQVSRQTLLQTRHYLHDLRPLLRQGEGIWRAIEQQVKEFRTITGLDVALTATGDEVAAVPAVKQALYRITQEGLANIFKHANASHIAVAVAFDGDGTRLIIDDDGQGFTPDTVADSDRRGYGLGTMRERAEEVGGHLAIVSAPGRGTRLEAWVPHQPPALSRRATLAGG